MKLKTVLVICLFFKTGSPVFSQNPILDSLQKLLPLQKDAGQRAELHLQIAEAFVLAEKPDSAIANFERALTGFEQTKNKAREAHCLGRLSLNIKSRAQHDRALQLDFKALKIWESLADERGVARSFCNLGIDFYYKINYKSGAEYSEKAIERSQKLGDEALLAESYRNAASNYLFLMPGDTSMSINRGPGLNEPRTKALDYLGKALEIAKRLPMSDLEIAKIENWRGNLLKFIPQNKAAIAAYAEAQKWFQKAGSQRGNNIVGANMANIYINTQQYAKALPILLPIIANEEKTGDSLNLEEHYNMARKIYENLNDYKNALDFLKKRMEIKWNTYTRERDEAMAEVQTKYETEKKEVQIAAQQAEITHKNKIQWLMFGLAGLLGLVLFLVWRTANFRKTANQKLAELNSNLEKKNTENVLLLKEIHHRVKNNLQTISSLLSLQSANLKDEESRLAVEAGQHRVQSMALIHQKLYQRENLAGIEMKDYLTNLGQSLFESFDVDEKRISLKIEMPETELDVDTAVPIGLIVNELVTNSLKYAFPNGRSGEVKISLKNQGENKFELEVSDNGVGISEEKSGTSFGSRLVKLLTIQLGGKLEQGIENGFWTRVRVG